LRDILSGEKLLRRIEWINALLMVLFMVGAWLLYSSKMALGVLQGGTISILSFEVLKWQLQRAFNRPESTPTKGGLFASYYLRYLGTLFLVFTVMYYGWANPIAFLVGLSTVMWSIFVVGGQELVVLLRKKGEG
jgi:hypothetical protein